MKNLLTIVTVMVFALFVGAVYADDQPTIFSGKDLGLALSDDAVSATEHAEMNVEKGAAAGGVRFVPGETYIEVKINMDRTYLGPGGSDLP